MRPDDAALKGDYAMSIPGHVPGMNSRSNRTGAASPVAHIVSHVKGSQKISTRWEPTDSCFASHSATGEGRQVQFKSSRVP